MATNGVVVPSAAGSTPQLWAPNGVLVVLPPQAVPQVPPAGYVTIDMPTCTLISVCLPPAPAETDPDPNPNPNLAVLTSVVVPEVLNPVVGNPNVGKVRPTCEVQINNLVDMQNKEGVKLSANARKRLVAQEALKEWKEAESGLQGKVERRTKQAAKLIFEVYQLVGLYSVFVGVVFTVALQSPFIKCQHIWSPVLLCLCAWLIIILVTRKRLIKYNDLRKTIETEDGSRSAIYGQISKLKSYGYEKFDFSIDAKEESPKVKPKDTSTLCAYFEGFLLVMVETVVHNDTDNDYHLKEGNAGHYRLLLILKKKTSTTVSCDTNATYREYWVGTAAGIPGAIISSDDCAECSKIRIVSSADGRNELKKTLRIPATTEAVPTHPKTCVIL